MNAIFKDSKLQEAYDRDGFVVLDDLMSEEEIARTRSVMADLREIERRKSEPSGFLDRAKQAIAGRKKPSHRRTILGVEDSFYFQTLEEEANAFANHAGPTFKRVYDRYLDVDYKNTIMNFLIRVGADRTKCHNHPSHMAFPSDYPQLILHIPLQDMDESSGPLTFVKGSHQPWVNRVQVMNLDSLDFSDIADQLESRTVPVCTRSGQGILFDSTLLHAAASHSDPDWERYSFWANAIPASCDRMMFTAEFDDRGKITSLSRQHGLKAEPERVPAPPVEHHGDFGGEVG